MDNTHAAKLTFGCPFHVDRLICKGHHVWVLLLHDLGQEMQHAYPSILCLGVFQLSADKYANFIFFKFFNVETIQMTKKIYYKPRSVQEREGSI